MQGAVVQKSTSCYGSAVERATPNQVAGWRLAARLQLSMPMERWLHRVDQDSVNARTQI